MLSVEQEQMRMSLYLVSVGQDGCIFFQEALQNFGVSSVQFSQFFRQTGIAVPDLFGLQAVAAS